MTALLKSLARRPRRIGTFGSRQIHQMNFTNCLMWKTIHKSSFGKGHSEDGVAVRQRGFKWLKPAQNKVTWCDFTTFYKSISADLHHFRFPVILSCIFKNLSNCCEHKYDQSISQIFVCNLWRGFVIWNLREEVSFMLVEAVVRMAEPRSMRFLISA